MKRGTLLGMLLCAGLAGCDVPPPKSPVEDPGIPEPEATEPEAGQGEAGEPEATEPKTGEPEPSAEPAPVEEVPCSKLKKGLCKATQGCAWRDPPNPGCIEASDMADVSGDE